MNRGTREPPELVWRGCGLVLALAHVACANAVPQTFPDSGHDLPHYASDAGTGGEAGLPDAVSPGDLASGDAGAPPDAAPDVATGVCTPGTTLPCTTAHPGPCSGGVQSCIAGTWGPCVPHIQPGSNPEDCTNTIDDDCDGKLPADDGDCDPCKNGAKDTGEADVDCGGACPTACVDGKSCTKDADCASGRCYGGTCSTDPLPLKQSGCYWKYTDKCGHNCGNGVSKEVLCNSGDYVAGFGTHTWDAYGRYHTRVYCCKANLLRKSCSWKKTDSCGHNCGNGVSKETVCAAGHYAAGFGVHTWGSNGRYNYRIYCCEDTLKKSSCAWKKTDSCGHSCGQGVSKEAVGPVGSYVAGFGCHTWGSNGRYNTRIYHCMH